MHPLIKQTQQQIFIAMFTLEHTSILENMNNITGEIKIQHKGYL